MKAMENLNAATIRRERIRSAQSVATIAIAAIALIATAAIAPRIAAKAHCEFEQVTQ